MKIKVWVRTNKVGSKCQETIDIDTPILDGEVLNYIEENMIDWGYEPIEEDA